jgi:hypothetical protein
MKKLLTRCLLFSENACVTPVIFVIGILLDMKRGFSSSIPEKYPMLNLFHHHLIPHCPATPQSARRHRATVNAAIPRGGGFGGYREGHFLHYFVCREAG